MAYTTIDDPSAFFQSLLYTGSGAPQDVTNEGNSDLQPDFVWTYLYNSSNGAPNISDSSRGVGSSSGKWLRTDSSGAENDDANGIRAFNSNGFKTGDGWFNGASGYKYIAWQLKANGGTTSSNTDGSITSTVQANQDAGFSIVTYTGTGSAGTIGHGLGVAPKVVIVKARTGVATSWAVFHKDGSTSDDDTLVLQTTAAKATYAGFWNNQYPSSSVFGISNDIWLNGNTENFVAYCFAEKQGYSKFGKYTGNSHSGGNGPFVYTGFTPAFVLIKRTDSTNDWIIHDYKLGTKNATGSSKGNIFNLNSSALRANEAASQLDDWGDIDMYSNGFKPRSDAASVNASGTYIYMAFAHAPFVSSSGIPTTAR